MPSQCEHRQHRGGLERGAVVPVQHRLGLERGDAFGQRRAAHQVRGMAGIVGVAHLPAHDLAAVQIQDQVQVEPPAHDCGRQVGHVPAPNLARRGGDVRARPPAGPRRLGSPAVGALPMLAQHAGEGGLAADIHAFVGQHRHDACRGHLGKAWLVGQAQHLPALSWAERMAGTGRSASGRPSPDTSPSQPFQRCRVRTSMPAVSQGPVQPRAGRVRRVDVSGQALAIFEADHSSSPLLKIAATFFDSTRSAAVSAKARSLRRSSRSSSLMRRRSCLVCCGLARASSGSASACVAGQPPSRQLLRVHPVGAAPGALAGLVHRGRGQSASNRAAAVQARSRAGLDSASLRQRSSVPAPTPISRATSSSTALSGGNNRATALSLNACPYRANSLSHHRPRVLDSIGATTILTRACCLTEECYRY